jgi:hypothetical protein
MPVTVSDLALDGRTFVQDGAAVAVRMNFTVYAVAYLAFLHDSASEVDETGRAVRFSGFLAGYTLGRTGSTFDFPPAPVELYACTRT